MRKNVLIFPSCIRLATTPPAFIKKFEKLPLRTPLLLMKKPWKLQSPSSRHLRAVSVDSPDKFYQLFFPWKYYF